MKETSEGLTLRSPDPTNKMRPFVLTRSFWAGSQRFGAMWSGDRRVNPSDVACCI